MTNSCELRILGEFSQVSWQIFRTEVDPADDGADEVVLTCQLQQPERLLKALPCLDGHRALKSVCCQQRLQISREEVSLQGRHLVRHPCVLGRTVTPEVLMGIDSH